MLIAMLIAAAIGTGGPGGGVAGMRREEGLRPAGHAERALQLRTCCDERTPGGAGQGQRDGSEPPGSANREGQSDDRVLAAPVDRTIVCEEGVGDPAQPLTGLEILVRDRLV